MVTRSEPCLGPTCLLRPSHHVWPNIPYFPQGSASEPALRHAVNFDSGQSVHTPTINIPQVQKSLRKLLRDAPSEPLRDPRRVPYLLQAKYKFPLLRPGFLSFHSLLHTAQFSLPALAGKGFSFFYRTLLVVYTPTRPLSVTLFTISHIFVTPSHNGRRRQRCGRLALRRSCGRR